MYLLDTNICIYGMKGRYESVTDKLLSIPPSEILISAVTISELEFGAAKSSWGEKTRIKFLEFLAAFQSVDYSSRHAAAFGMLRADLERRGILIGPYDMMIAAQCLTDNYILVTHNTDEFTRVKGLELVDWVEG